MYAHRKGLPVEPGPCDDCELAAICALGLACQSFLEFVATPQGTDHAWASAERIPTRERYRAIYRGSKPKHARPLTDDERSRILAAYHRERGRRDPEQAAADLEAMARAKPRDAQPLPARTSGAAARA